MALGGGGIGSQYNNNNNNAYNTLVGRFSLFRVPCSTFLNLSSEFPARLAVKSFPDFLSSRIPIHKPRRFFMFKPVHSPMVFPSDKYFYRHGKPTFGSTRLAPDMFCAQNKSPIYFPPYPFISTVLKLNIEPQRI